MPVDAYALLRVSRGGSASARVDNSLLFFTAVLLYFW
jgi:hypothetical protein